MKSAFVRTKCPRNVRTSLHPSLPCHRVTPLLAHVLPIHQGIHFRVAAGTDHHPILQAEVLRGLLAQTYPSLPSPPGSKLRLLRGVHRVGSPKKYVFQKKSQNLRDDGLHVLFDLDGLNGLKQLLQVRSAVSETRCPGCVRIRKQRTFMGTCNDMYSF